MNKKMKINRGVIILSVVLAVVVAYCVFSSVFESIETAKVKDICENYLADFAKCAELPSSNMSANGIKTLKNKARKTLGQYFTDDEEIRESIFSANDDYFDYMQSVGASISSLDIRPDFSDADIVFDGFDKVTISVHTVFSYVTQGRHVNSADLSLNQYYELILEKSNGQWYIMYADSMYDTPILNGGVN